MQATLHTKPKSVSQIFNIIKILQQSKHTKKQQAQEKKPVTKQKGNHNEPQKGTRQPNSILQITSRALNVKPQKTWFHHPGGHKTKKRNPKTSPQPMDREHT